MAWHRNLLYPCFSRASTASRPVRDTVPTAPHFGGTSPRPGDLVVFSRPRGRQQASPIRARVPSFRARDLSVKGWHCPIVGHGAEEGPAANTRRHCRPFRGQGTTWSASSPSNNAEYYARDTCPWLACHGSVSFTCSSFVLASLRVPRSKRASSRWIFAQLLRLCSSQCPARTTRAPEHRDATHAVNLLGADPIRWRSGRQGLDRGHS